MGADIYIESISEACREKYGPKFEAAVAKRETATDPKEKEAAQKLVSKYYDLMYGRGYFRDSYNGTSLFWCLGLSWWGDTGGELDDEGYLSVQGCKNLLAEVKARNVPTLKKMPEYLDGKYVVLDDDENSPAVWRKYFVNKRRRFIRFLEKAIELDEPIRCSV